jgi:hypothetical protein
MKNTEATLIARGGYILRQHPGFTVMALLLALTAFMLPAPAEADTISANTVLTPGEGGTYKNLWDGSVYPSDVYATEFDVNLTSEDMGLYNYCTYGYSVDVWQGTGDMSYPVELTYLSELSDTFFQVAWLLESFAGESGVEYTDDGDGSITDDPNVEAMALQALIWVTLTRNDLSYSPSFVSTEVSRQYHYYADQLIGHTLTDAEMANLGKHYMVAASGTYEDIMVRVGGGGDDATVPEPGTILLLGSATGIVALLRRREKRQHS